MRIIWRAVRSVICGCGHYSHQHSSQGGRVYCSGCGAPCGRF